MRRDETGGAVVRQYERLLEPGTVAGLTESEVVSRFAESGDPVAFEAIIRRHGPMVFSLCRQILRDANDVDDAFQATFLVLVKKARTLRAPERLGPWLHGVAYRVARRARTQHRPRAMAADRAAAPAGCPAEDRETLDAIHEEIEHLPDKYRLPVVLCCLEGLSHHEAAGLLGWPVGTVSGRLSRARERLRSRLFRRDITGSPSNDPALALLHPARDALPESITWSTVALLSGTFPPHLENLVKGVLATMLIANIKTIGSTLCLAAVGVIVATSALLAYQGDASGKRGLPDQALVVEPKAPAKDESPTRKVPGRTTEVDANESEWEEFDRLQVKAELLETEVEQERQAVADDKERLARLRLSDISQDGRTDDEFAKYQKSREDEILRWTMKLKEDRETYQIDRVELGRLKRQIARMSKVLGESAEPAATPSTLGRRLDRLERKVDQIIETLAAKKAR
jgi:RNA polymerase sigma factor (sigma-70 family)